MSKKEFFPARPVTKPTIYAYELVGVATHKGWLKIGYTDRDAQTRIKEQLGTAAIPYKIVFEESAMKRDGSCFSDHDVHRQLREQGFQNPEGEWFVCGLNDLRRAIWEIKTGERTETNRTHSFKMRPEQEDAVKRLWCISKAIQKKPEKTPHFLWNAKMRFGKTLQAINWQKWDGQKSWYSPLNLPYSAWEEDLLTHVDFKGWQFISRNGLSYEDADMHKPFVCFGSFQDYLGKNTSTGGIKTKNEWVHATHWVCVIFDEYHFGAWRDNAKELFEAECIREIAFGVGEGMDYFDVDTIPITTNHYLYLSGTPFRAIATGEFIEEQIFNWTYSDEQKQKKSGMKAKEKTLMHLCLAWL